MSHTRLWISAAIIAFVILITFALSVPHTRDLEIKPPLSIVTTSVPTVALHDSFKKGLHTISGSLETPNACTPISASTTLVGDATSRQSILVTISTPNDSGICLQVPTRTSFQTTIQAPSNLPITATVNGFEASTTPS